MTRPLLPPRGLFTGTRWLFDPALSAPVKETLLQIMALTWGRDGHTTPALSYPQLEALTGKNSRTLRGHLLALRSYHAALRLQRAGAGEFIVALAPWLFCNTHTAAMLEAGKNLPQPDSFNQEEEQEFLHLPGENLLVLDDHPAVENHTSAPLPVQAAKKIVTQRLLKRLLDAGVFPVLLDEVETRAAQWKYTAKELDRLLDWCADQQPEQPAALFIGRLRAGARAPAIYAQPACPQCGRRGKHAETCTQRYTQGF